MKYVFDDLCGEIWSLPVEAQRQVAEFVAFLRLRHSSSRTSRAPKVPLGDEPFIGMWRDRQDLQDSTEWVRRTRRKEWGEPNG